MSGTAFAFSWEGVGEKKHSYYPCFTQGYELAWKYANITHFLQASNKSKKENVSLNCKYLHTFTPVQILGSNKDSKCFFIHPYFPAPPPPPKKKKKKKIKQFFFFILNCPTHSFRNSLTHSRLEREREREKKMDNELLAG